MRFIYNTLQSITINPNIHYKIQLFALNLQTKLFPPTPQQNDTYFDALIKSDEEE